MHSHRVNGRISHTRVKTARTPARTSLPMSVRTSANAVRNTAIVAAITLVAVGSAFAGTAAPSFTPAPHAAPLTLSGADVSMAYAQGVAAAEEHVTVAQIKSLGLFRAMRQRLDALGVAARYIYIEAAPVASVSHLARL